MSSRERSGWERASAVPRSGSKRLISRLPNPWLLMTAVVLRGLRLGELTVTMPSGKKHRFGGRAPGPSAQVDLRDPSAGRRLVTGGGIGLAEGYMEGAWDTADLNAVLELGAVNLQAGWTAGTPVLLRPPQRIWHALRDNDLEGARRNVQYHYDLGNDFYRLWLDRTMTYSAACFDAGEEAETDLDLEAAQRRKWDRMLELVEPGRGDHLLEIGCGWGGFAIHAARETGCRVTGLTLSSEQAEWARARVAAEGVQDQVEIRLQDYREETGSYQGIVSIEMFEAVGERWWPTFFGKLGGLLDRRSRAALQVITITAEHFESYRRAPDFIQRYVFPGGMLPTVERFNESAAAAGLAVGEPRFFGPDYDRTLGVWADNFEAALPQVRELGFDERFIRMWRYYFAYCRAGFRSERTNVMQVALNK